MKFKQIVMLALVVACGGAWGADSLVAVPYRLVGAVPTTVNGQAGQRLTFTTGREGEACYLLLNDKDAQGGRIENIGASSHDVGFSCVRSGVRFGIVGTGASYFKGRAGADSTIEFRARLLSDDGQAMEVYTTRPTRIAF